ncbi:hypothetical protein ACLOJK_020886, partial [Asimina triloba]
QKIGHGEIFGLSIDERAVLSTPIIKLDFSIWATSSWRTVALAMASNMIEQDFLENLPNVREPFDPRKGEEKRLECILEAANNLEHRIEK